MFDLIVDLVLKYRIFLLAVGTLLLVTVTTFIWKRRWLYYHSMSIPGPFSLPGVGSVRLVFGGPESSHRILTNLFHEYPSTMRLWLGPFLYLSTTEPRHLKIILTKFLGKGNFYHLMDEYFYRALAAAPLSLWKNTRKMVNPTFNVSLISSFVDNFAKQANVLVKDLEKQCGRISDDLFPIMWRCTLDAGCATLADVDPALMKTDEFLPSVFRIEEILMQRFFNPFLHLDFFWNFSPLRSELHTLWKKNCSYIQKIIDLKDHSHEKSPAGKKRFLEHLVEMNQNQQIPHDYMLEEAQIMFFVGTETSGVALSSTLLFLGMFPHLQEKIDEELSSVFGSSTRDPTLEDINKLDYLERVIKESMRLLPPIPIVVRGVEEDIKLDDYVFPAGSQVLVPIGPIHRKPELWPDPLKFDPDRFLPEEVEKRPPCAYIPFSYGVRNCLGNKYAMLSMKVILAAILRRYRVTSSNYKSVEDIDLYIHVVAKPKKGYRVTLERKL